MTDRDLLELAAKAAGINGHWDARANSGAGMFIKECGRCWIPMSDDGDALRLAVKLNLTVGHHLGARHAGMPPCPDDYEDGKYPVRIAQIDGLDPYAATRRAIVRAAAAIGEHMP